MSGGSRTRRAVAVCAVLLGLGGGGLVWTAFTGSASPPPAPTAAPTPEPSAATPSAGDRSSPTSDPTSGSTGGSTGGASRDAGVRDLITGPTLPESDPVRVSIPRIGVASQLVRLGLDPAGAMEVPQDAALAGWYTLGPSPGALGPAVIAGHVTWNQAPAVFYRLGTMRPGDRVEVARQDGKRAVFEVTRVATYPKSQFPTRAVFGGIDHAGLRLITCGGDFDAVNHRYLHNVVVFARLLKA